MCCNKMKKYKRANTLAPDGSLRGNRGLKVMMTLRPDIGLCAPVSDVLPRLDGRSLSKDCNFSLIIFFYTRARRILPVLRGKTLQPLQWNLCRSELLTDTGITFIFGGGGNVSFAISRDQCGGDRWTGRAPELHAGTIKHGLDRWVLNWCPRTLRVSRRLPEPQR